MKSGRKILFQAVLRSALVTLANLAALFALSARVTLTLYKRDSITVRKIAAALSDHAE